MTTVKEKRDAKRVALRLEQARGVYVGGEDMEPLDTLGPAGLAQWREVWAGNNGTLLNIDTHMVQLLCESVDERALLRTRVFVDGNWRDRVALRTLDTAIARTLHLLGLNPTARHRLGNRARFSPGLSVIDELRARRPVGRGGPQ